MCYSITVLRILIQLYREGQKYSACPCGSRKERIRGDCMIVIDYTDRRPIYEQIAERFQSLVLCGILEKDEPLPSVRNLAMELSINPNTIQRAYTELERRGVIYAVKGKGNFVADIRALLALRERELEKEVRILVRKAKEANIAKDKVSRLFEAAWQDEAADMQKALQQSHTGGEAYD